MALKFLDDSNQGLTSDAVLAVNYATMMRTDFGENVRVLNASWGQSGGGSPALRTAIEAAGQADILFVAAAGNGNILGQGINIDREPFYPASYDLDNIITRGRHRPGRRAGPVQQLRRHVGGPGRAGHRRAEHLARRPVRHGQRHQHGRAARGGHGRPDLVRGPRRDAGRSAAGDPGQLWTRCRTATGDRHRRTLERRQALDSDAFAPRATLVSAPNITTAGGTDNLITVRYHDRQGIDETSLGDGDLVVTRQWGPKDVLHDDAGARVGERGRRRHGGDGDLPRGGPGRHLGCVGLRPLCGLDRRGRGQQSSRPDGACRPIGEFSVRIEDSSVFYVDTFDDAVDANVGDGICVPPRPASARCGRRSRRANAAEPPPDHDSWIAGRSS